MVQRANSPTNNDDGFAVTQLLDEVEQQAKVSSDQQHLAAVGTSEGWKMLRAYIEKRVDSYKQALFGEKLEGVDAATIGNRFLAAQSVISEFESLINEIDTVTKSVQDATKE